MPNLLASCGVALQTNAGDNLSRTVANLPANSKVDIDDVIAIGAYDLAPLCAGVTKPRFLQVQTEDPSGVTINIDGTGPSTMKVRTIFLEIITDIAPDVELVLTVAQRVRILCVGEE